MSKKVVLPSDLKGKDKSSASTNIAARGREKPPSDVGKQLEAVKAHIEDLHVRLINRLLRLAGAARHGYFHLTETRVFYRPRVAVAGLDLTLSVSQSPKPK